MDKSPLGLPLPEVIGRQAIPDMETLAREHGSTRASRSEDVMHVCFECAGPLASGLILVQTCRYCGGSGLLSDDQLARIMAAGHGVIPG